MQAQNNRLRYIVDPPTIPTQSHEVCTGPREGNLKKQWKLRPCDKTVWCLQCITTTVDR